MAVSLEFSEDRINCLYLDCTVRIFNTNNSTQSPEQPHQQGWFSYFSQDKASDTQPHHAELLLILGYIQLVGYVRINLLIGNNNSSHFWHNQEYLDAYESPEAHEQIEKIRETPFIRDYGGVNPKQGPLSVDFGKTLDQTGLRLLHDIAYQFNSLEEPEKMESSDQLVEEVKTSFVPFYVTAQSLLFSSVKIEKQLNLVYKIKLPKPTQRLPPSYNTKLTGSAGEAALVSIGYSVVVGLSEELSEKNIVPRAVYFPFEFRPEKHENYLDAPIVDSRWGLTEKPEKPAKDALLADIDELIASDVHGVAANERRKSSVSEKLPEKPKTSYQIRVNTNVLCQVILPKAVYHVGEDVLMFFDIPHPDTSTRVVGIVSHIEAHEVYHCEPEYVNKYKVTPTTKVNIFGKTIAAGYLSDKSPVVAAHVTLPRWLTLLFSAASFMDLKYFLVCTFVLNEFVEPEVEPSLPGYASYLHEHKFNNDSTKFTVHIPVIFT